MRGLAVLKQVLDQCCSHELHDFELHSHAAVANGRTSLTVV